MARIKGVVVAVELNGGAWMVDWRDKAGDQKTGRADHPESLLRLFAHALREAGHQVPELINLPRTALPREPMPASEVRHARPIRPPFVELLVSDQKLPDARTIIIKTGKH